MNKQNNDWSREVENILETVYEKALEGNYLVDSYKERVLFFNNENLKSIITNLLKEQLDRVDKEVIGKDEKFNSDIKPLLTSSNLVNMATIVKAQARNEQRQEQRQKLEMIKLSISKGE